MVKKIKLLSAAAVFFAAYAQACAGFPEPYGVSADITDADKKFALKENVLTISYSRPALSMRPFEIVFKFDKDNIKSLSFDTNMKMNMGRYVFIPKKIGGSGYSATLTLPKCASGNTLWYGRLDITYDSGTRDTVIFFYNVK